MAIQTGESHRWTITVFTISLLYTYPPQSDLNATDRRCWSPVKTWQRQKRLILQGMNWVTDILKSRKTATLTTRSSIETISVLPEDYKRAEGRKKSRTREKRNKRIKMASFLFNYVENFCARADDRNHISRLFFSAPSLWSWCEGQAFI